MKTISVFKDGKLKFGPTLPQSEAEALAWLEKSLAKNRFGLPERPELDELGKETGRTLPAEFSVVIEDFEESYSVLRAKEFAKLDQMKNEALIELLAENRPEKMEQYKSLRSEIKLRFPKA